MATRQRLTYDSAVAASYAKYRGVWPEVLQHLVEKSAIGRDSRVLEVGCGTGNYIIAMQFVSGCAAHGVDISEEMLTHAMRRDTPVQFAVGSAEYLEIADGSLDVVFSVDVIHHLGSPAEHYREAHRALATGGLIFTVTRSADMLESGTVMARYFPESVAANQARYPSAETLREQLAGAGLNAVHEAEITCPVEVADAAHYASKAWSALHLIPDDAFERGLAALERDLEQGPIQGERRHLMLWARK